MSEFSREYHGYIIRKNVAGGYEVLSGNTHVTEFAGLRGAREAVDALVELGSPSSCDVVDLLGKICELRGLREIEEQS